MKNCGSVFWSYKLRSDFCSLLWLHQFGEPRVYFSTCFLSFKQVSKRWLKRWVYLLKVFYIFNEVFMSWAFQTWNSFSIEIRNSLSSEFVRGIYRESNGKERKGRTIASFTFRIRIVLIVEFFLSCSGQLFCHTVFRYWLSVEGIVFFNFMQAHCYSLRQSKYSDFSSLDNISLWVNFLG